MRYNTDLQLHTLFFQKCVRNYFFQKCSNIWQGIQIVGWCVQGGFEVSIHGDIQNSIRNSPEAEFCLSRGLGLHHMQRGLAASATLWFCDLLAVSELTVVIDLIWFHIVSFLMNSKVFLPLSLWPATQVAKVETKLKSATKNQYTATNMPDGCNYELVILSAVWTCKAKKSPQPTNQIYSLKNESLEIGSKTLPVNKRIFFLQIFPFC